MYPEPIQNLIDMFRQFPGIGPRQAARFVFHLLNESEAFRKDLAAGITNLADLLLACTRCGNIESRNAAAKSLCSICANASRDQKRIAVVEEVVDLRALERTRTYQGIYHVLAGNIGAKKDAVLNTAPVKRLLARVKEESPEEIILATNPTYEGDTTARYLERELAALDVKVTRLARGLAKGVDLEYVDEETLKEALAGRH